VEENQMACEAQKAALAGLEQQYGSLLQELQRAGPETKAQLAAKLEPKINTIETQIEAATKALNSCLAAAAPQRVPGAQPKNCLQIQYTNPSFGGNNTTDDDWANAIAGGEFPWGSDLEWKQVMDTTNEYDTTPAAATGWAMYTELSQSDMIGDHPFGNDWEFALVLDTEYSNLLSYGNIALQSGDITEPDAPTIQPDLTKMGIDADAISNALRLGMLGVEWDHQLVPQGFQNEFADGNRVAVLGRWIVDCGHTEQPKDQPDKPVPPAYHTEIHPPLLLATAGVYRQTSPNLQYTRAAFISRAYLPGQTFTTSTDPKDIYSDSSADDGPFLKHLANEIVKAEDPVGGSGQVECHPKIKQYPFKGINLIEVIVRTTEIVTPVQTIEAGHGLVVSFHFTVRSGCAVQVVPNDASSVRVVIAMNNVGYTPPALPTRNTVGHPISELLSFLDKSTLVDLLTGIGAYLNTVLDPKGAIVLAKGIITDLYAPIADVNFTDRTSADVVINAPGNSIPFGKGVTVDNTQPYPLSGWIEVGYANSQLQSIQGTAGSRL